MIHEKYIKPATVDPIIRRLTETRLAWGLSTEEVAKRVGCSRFKIAHLEAGERVPGYKVLLRWCDALGLELLLIGKVVE